MIIKRLKLQNIRSYKDQVVEFPLGKTLFEGDIGSGKSTILMAIEFALFGLGSEKPGSLLKAGENDALVAIVFESGGKEYTVKRRLVKKKNSYAQDDCELGTAEGHCEYSATEIKEKVLEILDFNEPPDPKAQSMIYRYAIYTPQEEIKNVLALKPDLRLQTLRKAFRLEDYKVASENARNLHGEIRQKARDYERDASEIPSIRDKIKGLESWAQTKSNDLMLIQKRQEIKKEQLAKLKTKLDGLQKEQLALKAETGRIEDLIQLLDNKKSEVESAKKQIENLKANITRIEPRISKLNDVENPGNETQEELQREIQAHKTREKQLRAEETKIRTKLEDYNSILKEKVCPTCEQEIAAATFTDKLEHKQSELKSSRDRVEECAKALEQLETKLSSKREYDQAQASLKELVRNHDEYLEDLKIHDTRREAASTVVRESTQKLEQAKESMQKLEKVDLELEDLKRDIDECDFDLEQTTGQITEGQAQIKEWKRQLGELEESLKKKQEQKQKAEKLNEYVIWIQDYFMPTIEIIEKQVLMNINLEFNSQFQKWFGMLIEDPGKQAKIDEDFTPVIEQDGIDQDVSFLSGGEKTSIALAYRLALNNIVRRVSTGMQSNMLILDEPTDGFSKEQLGRVREILDELQCPQIILVSHEKELESFADQIYRVSKTDGLSTITVGK